MRRTRALSFVATMLAAAVGFAGIASAAPTSESSRVVRMIAAPSARAGHPHDAIVFSNDDGTGHFQLFIARSDGKVRQLTHLPRRKDAYEPQWSPDGKRVAFTVETAINDEIYTIRADGKHLRQLTNSHDHSASSPHWSPDGTKFVYQRSKPHGHCDVGHDEALYLCHLWIMHSDGSHAHALPTDEHFEDFDPAWSPNGEWIAFDSTREGLMSAVWVMRADGTDAQRITPARTIAGWPTWSPTGRQIAFTNLTDDGGLFTARRGGGRLQVLAEAGTSAHDFPSWAGDRIAFATYTKAGTSLVTMLADGTKRHVVVRGLNDDRPFLDYQATQVRR